MNHQGFLTQNIAGMTAALEAVLSNAELTRAGGWLQKLDSRVKLLSTVVFIMVVGLARNFGLLITVFALILILVLISKIPPVYFLKRVLLFIPVFTLVVAIPALFITPGDPALNLFGRVIITEQGLRTAGLLFLRVTDSLSFGILLILTTPWNYLLAALRWFQIPSLFVEVLGMTYRYIFLFLHTANTMFLARRSRTIGGFSAGENRSWLVRALGVTLAKTQYLSEEVYLAMLSRGYQGEISLISDLKFQRRDLIWAVFTLTAAAVLIWVNTL